MDFVLETGPLKNTKTSYEVIIIGSGPAGASAAIYLKRKGIDVLVLGAEHGGQVKTTKDVENYPGISFVSGSDLAAKFFEHMKSQKLEIRQDEVLKISKPVDFEVETSSGTLQARQVLIATGAERRKLGVPGEEKLVGRGVAYCAICDGPFFAGLDVVVAGGGNAAVESATDLAKIAKSVTLVHRSDLKADQVEIDRMMKLDNVKVRLETKILEIRGEGKLESLLLQDKDGTSELKTDGLFIEIGNIPRSGLVKDLVQLNAGKEIITDAVGRTSLEGLYAAGDVTDVKYKQIVIAAGMGAQAALGMSDDLKKEQ